MTTVNLDVLEREINKNPIGFESLSRQVSIDCLQGFTCDVGVCNSNLNVVLPPYTYSTAIQTFNT